MDCFTCMKCSFDTSSSFRSKNHKWMLNWSWHDEETPDHHTSIIYLYLEYLSVNGSGFQTCMFLICVHSLVAGWRGSNREKVFADELLPTWKRNVNRRFCNCPFLKQKLNLKHKGRKGFFMRSGLIDRSFHKGGSAVPLSQEEVTEREAWPRFNGDISPSELLLSPKPPAASARRDVSYVRTVGLWQRLSTFVGFHKSVQCHNSFYNCGFFFFIEMCDARGGPAKPDLAVIAGAALQSIFISAKWELSRTQRHSIKVKKKFIFFKSFFLIFHFLPPVHFFVEALCEWIQTACLDTVEDRALTRPCWWILPETESFRCRNLAQNSESGLKRNIFPT